LAFENFYLSGDIFVFEFVRLILFDFRVKCFNYKDTFFTKSEQNFNL